MKLIDFNWHPTPRQLREFAVICMVALPAVAWLWGVRAPVVGLLALIGFSVAVAGSLRPNLVKPLFLGLMVVATPIGMVLGELAMLLIFAVVFLPIGLVFRLLRRDPLQRKIDRDASTYWQTKQPPRDVRSYYRQS